MKKQKALKTNMKRCAEMIVSSDFDGNISKLCEELGIARSTYYKWIDREDFREYIKTLINQYTDSELVNIWKTVVESAKKGNLQALKLLIDFKNSQKVTDEEKDKVVFISGEERIEE